MKSLAARLRRAKRVLVEREWSDLLSPILVKEARQGVRGNAFTGALLLIQALMVLSVLGGLAFSGGRGASATSGLFWSSVGIPALVILPLSGLTALSSERELGTLEPILMTRLSAVRIVAGKWAGLVAQVLLLFTSVLPFVLLRYFLGGVDLSGELLLMLELVLSSTLIAALAVALSASPLTNLFRLLVVVVVGVPLHSIIHFVIDQSVYPHLGTASLWSVVAVLVLWVISALMLCDGGAAMLLKGAEHSPARMRLLGVPVALLGLWSGAMLDTGGGEAAFMLVFWAGTLLLGVLTGGLVEECRRSPLADAAWFARGRFRLAAGWLLAPGWPSGTVYAWLVLWAVMAGAWVAGGMSEHVALWGLATLATLLQPVTLTQWLAPRTRRRGVLYVLFVLLALGTMFITAVLSALDLDQPSIAFRSFSALSPLGYLIHQSNSMNAPPLSTGFHLAFSIVVALSIGGAVVFSIRALVARRRRLRPAPAGPEAGLVDGAVEA